MPEDHSKSFVRLLVAGGVQLVDRERSLGSHCVEPDHWPQFVRDAVRSAYRSVGGLEWSDRRYYECLGSRVDRELSINDGRITLEFDEQLHISQYRKRTLRLPEYSSGDFRRTFDPSDVLAHPDTKLPTATGRAHSEGAHRQFEAMCGNPPTCRHRQRAWYDAVADFVLGARLPDQPLFVRVIEDVHMINRRTLASRLERGLTAKEARHFLEDLMDGMNSSPSPA